MKFTVDSSTLLKHIKDLGTKKGKEARAREAIRFSPVGRRKVLMTIVNPFDGTTRSVEISATTCSETILTVSRNQFQAALEMAPKGKVTIASTKGAVTIGDSISVSLLEMDYADDVYAIPTPEKSLILPTAVFRSMLADVSHATCQDVTKYNLHGVYFFTEADKVKAVTTDGHRLAITSRPGWADDHKLLVPNDILSVLKPLIKGTEEFPVSLGIYAPPPPPVEYEDIYAFNLELPGGSSNATYKEKSFNNVKQSKITTIDRYKEQLKEGAGEKTAWLKGKIEEVEKYLAYLDTIVPTQREVKKTVCRVFVARCGIYTISARIDYDGEFPDYNRVIPNMPPNAQFRVDAKDLLDIVNRMPLGKSSQVNYNRVIMEFSETECKLSQHDHTMDITFTEKLPVEADIYSPITINFNQRYLADVLKTVEREVIFCMKDELTPIRIEDADREGRIFVIMPMRP